VKKTLPKLEMLDDKPLTDVECLSPQNVFDADWAYLEELQNDAVLIEAEDNDMETGVYFFCFTFLSLFLSLKNLLKE
jgi:hypothetical protein